MKARYIKETVSFCLTKNKVYDILAIEKNWYRIIDDTGEDYLYPSEYFEIETNNELDNYGRLTEPFPSDMPGYDFQALRKYCEEKGKHLSELLYEKIEQFRTTV